MLAILESIVSRTSMVIIGVSSSYLTAVSKLMFYKCVCTVVRPYRYCRPFGLCLLYINLLIVSHVVVPVL